VKEADESSDDSSSLAYDVEDEIYLGVYQGEEYFISKKALQEHILRTEVGMHLVKDEDIFTNKAEQVNMREIITTS